MNAEELLKKLVESRIPFALDCEHFGGIPYLLPRIAQQNEGQPITHSYLPPNYRVSESLEWLGSTAAELYPESLFTKWWRERNG